MVQIASNRFVVLLAVGAVSSACAVSDIPLALATGRIANPVEGGGGRQVIVILPFTDDREIGERCGMQKNVYGRDAGDAVCQGDPKAWLARRLADALRASGFSVLEEGSDALPGALRIEGSLIKIFVEPVLRVWSGSVEADLSVRLRATTESGLAAERTFFVKGWRDGQLVSTQQPYQTALERATPALLEEMVAAIVELMDRYPQLGFRLAPTRVLALQLEVAER